jgi:hypothetical protein
MPPLTGGQPMRTRRPPTRWSSIRKERRLVARGRSARRHHWSEPVARAHESGLGAENRAPERDLASARSGADADEQAPPAFVELFPARPAAPPECTIELEMPSGTKMTISLQSAHGAELLALIASLWRAAR